MRDERLGRYGGRFNLKRIERRKRNRYARERAETCVCRRAVQSAQGDVRERLCHAVRGIDRTLSRLKFCRQLLINGAAAQYDRARFKQKAARSGIGKHRGCLHRRECAQVNGLTMLEERIGARLDGNEVKAAFNRAHDHHFSGNEAKRHSQQVGAAGFKPQKRDGGPSARPHAAFFCCESLGNARRSAGVHRYGCAGRKEFREESAELGLKAQGIRLKRLRHPRPRRAVCTHKIGGRPTAAADHNAWFIGFHEIILKYRLSALTDSKDPCCI